MKNRIDIKHTRKQNRIRRQAPTIYAAQTCFASCLREDQENTGVCVSCGTAVHLITCKPSNCGSAPDTCGNLFRSPPPNLAPPKVQFSLAMSADTSTLDHVICLNDSCGDVDSMVQEFQSQCVDALLKAMSRMQIDHVPSCAIYFPPFSSFFFSLPLCSSHFCVRLPPLCCPYPAFHRFA